MSSMSHINKAFEQMLQFNSPEGRVAANQATIADRELRHKALVERRQATQKLVQQVDAVKPPRDFIKDLQDGLYGSLD